MRQLVQQVRFQHIFSALAVFTVISFLWYSNSLVRSLAAGEQARIAFYASSLEFVATHSNQETEFVFNNVVKKQGTGEIISVPAIVVDEAGTASFDNLELDPNLSASDREKRIARELQRMKDAQIKPIQVEYVPGAYQFVYYRESDVLSRLRFYPYVMVAVLAIFVLGAFLNLYIINRNQQNRLWAGLAKETAHQLGTPIMGLLAWIELLKDRMQTPSDQEVLGEMQRDVVHLERIAERFSKIGSEPELVPTPLTPILDDAVQYVRSRLASNSRVSVVLASELPAEFSIPLNPTLFAWVIENLVKNALDAMVGQKQGSIIIRAIVKQEELILEVEDTGKGIPKGKLKDIFKPGFTTKRRGWGLGLSLSKRIVENYHKGKIFVKRTEVGKGSTFRVVLPVKKEFRPNLREDRPSDASWVN